MSGTNPMRNNTTKKTKKVFFSLLLFILESVFKHLRRACEERRMDPYSKDIMLKNLEHLVKTEVPVASEYSDEFTEGLYTKFALEYFKSLYIFMLKVNQQPFKK